MIPAYNLLCSAHFCSNTILYNTINKMNATTATSIVPQEMTQHQHYESKMTNILSVKMITFKKLEKTFYVMHFFQIFYHSIF